MTDIDLRFRAKDLRDDPEQMQLLLRAIQIAAAGRATFNLRIGSTKLRADTRDPELGQQIVRAVEKRLADEAARVERAKEAAARLPEIAPPSAEDIVRATDSELHRAIGRLVARSVGIAARVVKLGIEAARLFS